MRRERKALETDVQWAGKSCLSGCSEAVSGVGDDDDA